MKGHEVIARVLERRSVEVVFGLMGNGNMPFCHAWADDVGGRYVAAWHEAQAVAMARGYAKATGGPAVATVTHGPGLTNAVTALTACVRARAPMVLVLPDIARGARGRMQQIDQAAVVAPTGARFLSVTEPEAIAPAADEALDIALAEQTAVVLNVPVPVLQVEQPDDAAERRTLSTYADGRRHAEPDAADLERAADLLAEARRPLIVAGRGAIPGDAKSAIAALAEASGALLGSTLPLRGYFNGEPFHVGAVGGYGTSVAVELCAEADLVLGIGASLHGRTTGGGANFAPGAKIVQVDVSPQAIGWLTKVDHAVVGDARVVAERLRELVAQRRPAGGFRTEEVAARLRDHDPSADFEDRSGDGLVDPRALMLELDAVVPAERSVIMDGGHSTGFSSIYMPSPDDRAYAFGLTDYSSIGLGMGMAIGVAVARPDRYPVFFTGDGTLMMTLGDLHSVARHGLPMLVVVMNDNAYGSEVHEAHHLGLPTTLSTHESPGFEAVARSLGFEAATARSLADVRAAAERAVASGRPFLIDCFIHPEVVGSWAEAFHKERAAQPVG